MSAQRPKASSGPASSSGPRPRILRIGLLLGGKIVEERLIRERTPVSIGQSMKNTFSIPIEGLPLEFTLFALEEGKYYLRFLGKMDGRLSDSTGQVNTLDGLKGRGAQQHGDYWQVPLGENSRGKLSLGDLTVLFQFVTEPPRQPKPMLPASVRGTFADRFDQRLSVILGASIIAHFVIAIVAMRYDIEEDGITERAYNLTFKQDTYQVDVTPPPEPVPSQGSAAGSGGGSAALPDKKPEKPSGGGKPSSGGRGTNDAPSMTEDDASKFADLLTGEGPNGTSEGDMSKRRPGADLGAQINDVRDSGKQVAIGGGSGRTSRGDGDARVGTGTGPKIDAPGGIASAGGGKTTETGPSGRISVSNKQAFDESSLTPDLVLSKIQSAYMAGLKRCYKQYLNKDASARGAVKLEFEVNATGRALNGKATGFSGEVDSCISSQMSSWRFPIPKDKDGDPTDASFAITLQLVPD